MPNVSTVQHWDTGPECVPNLVADEPIATAAATKATPGARNGVH
jgi:hypothetical protein